MLDEAYKRVYIRMVAYQHKVAWYINSKVQSKIFRVGDLVLHQAEVSQLNKRDKLSPNWKGLYQVEEIQAENLPTKAIR